MTEDAIPAATLIVVRERGDSAPELLMVERAPGMAFAGGAWVFPGGRIDSDDAKLAHGHCFEDGPARVAAIRETLEETAIALALQPDPLPEAAERLQQRLAAGTAFDFLLETEGLILQLEELVPFARWIPEHHAKRRFDTLFFVAKAPDGAWTPRIIADECTAARWTSAAEMLERDRAGDVRIIFPTRRTLERLAQHDSFEAIAADARAHSVEPIIPWVEEEDAKQFLKIPEDRGFPITRERIDRLWRG